jgi:hypothetical protein
MSIFHGEDTLRGPAGVHCLTRIPDTVTYLRSHRLGSPTGHSTELVDERDRTWLIMQVLTFPFWFLFVRAQINFEVIVIFVITPQCRSNFAFHLSIINIPVFYLFFLPTK